jgi:preprotein translocase subunit SecG
MISMFATVPVLLAQAVGAAKTAAKAVTTAAPLPANLQNFQFQQVHESWLQVHAPWLTHVLAGLFMIAAVLLIGLLSIQTTKQEGLSGTIGGRVESAYGSRRGFDQQLAYVTSLVAISFVVLATMISLSGI